MVLGPCRLGADPPRLNAHVVEVVEVAQVGDGPATKTRERERAQRHSKESAYDDRR